MREGQVGLPGDDAHPRLGEEPREWWRQRPVRDDERGREEQQQGEGTNSAHAASRQNWK